LKYLAIKWIHRNIAPFGGSAHNLTIYGESHGSGLVELLLRTPLLLPVARAITQSGQSNTPISTPKSLVEQNSLYTALKSHLSISTLSELQAVPFADLLAAYNKADPSAGLGPSFVIDGHFLTEEWKESSFKGPIMIGNTGAEECVLQSVCAFYPRQTPPPTLSTLIATLSPILSPEVLENILTAYSINEHLESSEIIDRLLKLVADIIFCTPAQEHAVKWRKQDLAYLHGVPEIFAGTADPAGELEVQRAMQDAWIAFASGEEGWGKSGLVRRFGPGEVVDESVETVLKKWNRGDAWHSWEGLGAEQIGALVGLSALFVGGFIGFETTS
jgi:carboxylesterase type B